MSNTDPKLLSQQKILPPRSREEQLSVAESILFASGEPVSREILRKTLGVYTDEMDEIIRDLEEIYNNPVSGLTLSITDETLQLESKPANHPYIRQALNLERKNTLTKAGSEVLAILAYSGPLTRIEVDQLRGVNSAGALQRLIDQGFVEECGKREVPGRPYLYRTTDLFLRLAGIRSLKELPSFESFKEQINKLETENE